MKIYFAGLDDGLCESPLSETANILLSFFYDKKKIEKRNFSSLFLDSGAFSAFTLNVSIDIKEYALFLQKNHEKILCYANLDVIGDAVSTFENQKYLDSCGLTAIPVFHFNDDFQYLEHYCTHYPYIALGGMVGRPIKELREFLNKSFTLIRKFWPVKVHGFGVTNVGLLLEYPFYSVDSTSWLFGGKTGSIGILDTFFNFKSLYYLDKKILDNFFTRDFYFDTNEVKAYRRRNSSNIMNLKQIESRVTNLWKERGIEWND